MQEIIDAFKRPPPPKGLTRKEWENTVKEALEAIYEAELKTEAALDACQIVSDLLDRNNMKTKSIHTLLTISIESKMCDDFDEFVAYIADRLAEGAQKVGDYYSK